MKILIALLAALAALALAAPASAAQPEFLPGTATYIVKYQTVFGLTAMGTYAVTCVQRIQQHEGDPAPIQWTVCTGYLIAGAPVDETFVEQAPGVTSPSRLVLTTSGHLEASYSYSL